MRCKDLEGVNTLRDNRSVEGAVAPHGPLIFKIEVTILVR